MPDLVEKATGQVRFVPPERLSDAIASGLFEAPNADDTVSVKLPGSLGSVGEVRIGDLARSQTQSGTQVETEASRRSREREARLDREHSGVGGKLATVAENAIDTVTLGGGGIVLDHLGGEEYAEDRRERTEANPISAGVGTGAGIGVSVLATGGGAAARLAAKTPLGAVTKLGSNVARGGEGASVLARGGRILAGGAVEGGGAGFGEGVQELNNSDDPLKLERIASTLSSNVLFGAAAGAGANVLGHGVEKALRKGSKLLGEYAEGAGKAATGEIPEDLARMTAKDLKGARQVELDAIEAARVPERAKLSEEITAFRREMKEQKVWLATKGAEEPELRSIGKRTLKADKALDNLIDDPKYFAENPKGALSSLRKQEAALDELVTKHGDTLRAKFAKDASGDRLSALDNAAKALERNRALQKSITNLAAAPNSARLVSIDDAREALTTGGAQKGKTLFDRVAEGATFSGVAGVVGSLPIPGAHVVAPFLGARAAEFVTGKLSGQLGKAAQASAARMSKAVDAFADVVGKATPAAPVLATKVLSNVAFGPTKAAKADDARGQSLAKLYKERADEIRSQTALGPDGQPKLRPEARRAMSERLAPIKAVDPIAADRIETASAARIAYYARKLPRKPDLGELQTGPDLWQPSDMEMRSWARKVAAGEDPDAIAERLVDGSITPEDAEVLRELYPEMLADLTQSILAKLPTLQETLPYHRRLALSILTGVPVDPAMNPRVLLRLQASFKAEPGTNGGTQAPRPQPAFGSVKAHATTPAQQRDQESETV